MADILIRHLKTKGNEHSALALLVNQWGFDEQLIPKALQTVGGLFPHYSRHDESHSKQILINVERLLGINITLLTATDTWLLLEAAYWHDIGMVVPQKDLEEAINELEFKKYLQELIDTPSHELYRFARSFDPSNHIKMFGGADTPVGAIDKFRQLMAEWFRRKHATRSASIVQEPLHSLGITSPRTELIPARLFKLLAQICAMHGEPFHKLISADGLPFKEAGLAQEDCHPRFIACLLRMGDLLDLDDNRFCPVMQKISGENRPKISRAHEDKHAGIRHLRIDQERIEVTAECTTIDGYLETFKWFDWLKQEIQNQMSNWQDIVPDRALGLLPTLGAISVRLSGQLQVLKEGSRPQFGIDDKKAMDLLQGSNLYSTKFACIRELLQNAVDASLLKLWVTLKERSHRADWDSPLSERIQEILVATPIQIELVESPEPDVPPSEKSKWTLTITDNGTGISRTDLAHMLRIGGSHSNRDRQQMIKSMPEWMKPSGAFGIGFQSLFMLSDEVKVKTKSIFSNETLEITMFSPTGQNEGLVLLKQSENDVSVPCGTQIRLEFELETFPNSYSISYGRNADTMSLQLVQLMDPILDRSFPYEAGKIFDQIKIFSEKSILPIIAKLNTKSKSFDMKPKVEISVDASFVKTSTGDELTIVYEPSLIAMPNLHETYYRGQPFESKSRNLPFVNMSVNLMSGSAGTWLMANRDSLRPGAENLLDRAILDALELKVHEDFRSSRQSTIFNGPKRPIFGLFLEAMALRFGGQWKEFAKDISGAWLELPCGASSAHPDFKKFADFFAIDTWIVGEEESNGPPVLGCDLIVSQTWPVSLLSIILNEWMKDKQRTIQILDVKEDDESLSIVSDGSSQDKIKEFFVQKAKYRLRYQLKKEPQPFYTNGALASGLMSVIPGHSGNSRFLLQSSDRWKTLAIKDGTRIRASYLFPVGGQTDYILLPFLYRGSLSGEPPHIECTTSQLDALCEWLEPRLLSPATRADLQEKYRELVDHIDCEIMRSSSHWEQWKKLRRLHDLSIPPKR